jgi:hypothetical protein
MIVKYKYGLFHKDKLYGWKHGVLFRLPQMIGKRFYGLKMCSPWKDGYYLGEHRKSKSQLEAMTIVIDKEISVIKDSDVPF